jgi:predicted nucleic acid binding AN1-type Zn finger protein
MIDILDTPIKRHCMDPTGSGAQSALIVACPNCGKYLAQEYTIIVFWEWTTWIKSQT